MSALKNPTLALALGLAALTALAACEGSKDATPIAETGRSNAVTAPAPSAKAIAQTNPAGATSAKAAATPPTGTGTPAAPRKLCVDQAAHSAPRGAVKTLAASGATALPASIAFGTGKWTWVNLWAAWCGPCKEEIPRLINFQSRLRTSGVLIDLAFVSLDDDERQLTRFLEGQPAAGLRASYWLPEGPSRDAWIGALGATNATNLPVHALVAPSGQVACLVQGAVEESDYAAIADIVGAKR